MTDLATPSLGDVSHVQAEIAALRTDVRELTTDLREARDRIEAAARRLAPTTEAMDLDHLREAVNDYLSAQNFHGYKDRGRSHDARRHLCEVVYEFNLRLHRD